MAEPIQCSNCGAILLAEDIFCGECGTPRPSGPEPPKLTTSQGPLTAPGAVQTPAPSPSRPARSAQTGWRIAAIALGIVGAILCLLGLAAFLLFGLTESADLTVEENWLYSTFCCLLPIAGTGAILALAGTGIWWMRLRSR